MVFDQALPKFPKASHWTRRIYEAWRSEFVAALQLLLEEENLCLDEGHDVIPDLGKRVLEVFE